MRIIRRTALRGGRLRNLAFMTRTVALYLRLDRRFIQSKHPCDGADECLRSRDSVGGRFRVEGGSRVIRQQAKRFSTAKGSSHFLINTTGLNCVLGKRRYNSVMRSGQLMLWDAATQQCRSREIEHCVIRSVDGTVGITISQLASACQSTLALSLEVAGQWGKCQRMIPSRATFRRKPGLGKRSG